MRETWRFGGPPACWSDARMQQACVHSEAFSPARRPEFGRAAQCRGWLARLSEMRAQVASGGDWEGSIRG